MIRSALASAWASDGPGSNVCEFVASGTMPWRRIRSPPMFRAIELIGRDRRRDIELVGAAGQLVVPAQRGDGRHRLPW